VFGGWAAHLSRKSRAFFPVASILALNPFRKLTYLRYNPFLTAVDILAQKQWHVSHIFHRPMALISGCCWKCNKESE
jgi:hypothetical protein